MARVLRAAERRRAQILEAARRRFASRGLSGTVEELADEIGVGRRTIYRYFPTREHLALAVQLDILERWAGLTLERSSESVGNGLERIAALFELFSEHGGVSAEEIRFTRFFESTGVGEQPPDDELGSAFRAVHERLAAHAADLVRMGMSDGSIRGVADPDVTAATLLNGYLALAQQVYVRYDSLPEEQRAFARATLSEQARLYLRGLAGEGVPDGPVSGSRST